MSEGYEAAVNAHDAAKAATFYAPDGELAISEGIKVVLRAKGPAKVEEYYKRSRGQGTIMAYATRTRQRLEDLAPEVRAKVEAARAVARTPEAKAREEAIRAAYADKPSVRELVGRGDFDPETATAGNVRYALLRATAALKRAREARGLSLAEASERAGIDRAALSRLENGQNLNPRLETIGRYAGALGLEVNVSIDEPTR